MSTVTRFAFRVPEAPLIRRLVAARELLFPGTWLN
jgi:hypothetical protein